jgi:hypothetical protein
MNNLLSAKELSRILAISEFTVKKLARENQIPYTVIKNRPRFSIKSLLEYFRALEGGAA